MESSGLVILAVGVTVAGAEAVSIKQGKGFVMRPVIAGFVLGAVLMLIGAADGSLGSGFCWLVIVGSMLRNGSVLLGAASNATAPATTVKKG